MAIQVADEAAQVDEVFRFGIDHPLRLGHRPHLNAVDDEVEGGVDGVQSDDELAVATFIGFDVSMVDDGEISPVRHRPERTTPEGVRLEIRHQAAAGMLACCCSCRARLNCIGFASHRNPSCVVPVPATTIAP